MTDQRKKIFSKTKHSKRNEEEKSCLQLLDVVICNQFIAL